MGITKKDLVEKLKELKIEFPEEATNKELKALIVEAEKGAEEIKEDDADAKIEEPKEDDKEEEAKEEEEAVTEDEEKIVEDKEEEVVEEKDKEYDYLKQYEVRPPDPGSKAATMKKFLLSQPTVNMMIPQPDDDKVGKFPVNLNMYHLEFPKDTYIDVPRAIADVIRKSQGQTSRALRSNRIDSEDKRRAL